MLAKDQGENVSTLGRPEPVIDHWPKCYACGRTLAEYLTRPWSLRCRRCKAENTVE